MLTIKRDIMKHSKHSDTYIIEDSLGMLMNLKILKTKLPTVWVYLDIAADKTILPFDSFEELGEKIIDICDCFEETGIYRGFDMLLWMGCEIIRY